jgi:NAD(P)H-dependent FMN reductase
MPVLSIIVGSTREGRAGAAIASWFLEVARKHGGFQVELIDLKEMNLPLLDEPNHPRLRKYEHDHTHAWSAKVARSDAFVFVTPEYNHGPPPALLNALDYVYMEWNYKPAAFVSYGGVSGGTRSVQMTKLILNTLKVVPLVEAIALPHLSRQLDPATGAFPGGENYDQQARTMLDELLRWTSALKSLR